ncbi:MAG: hypothetical protein ACR2QS_07880 [Woeseiaceae bacterium]
MSNRNRLPVLCTSLFLALAVANPAAAGDVYAGLSPNAQQTAENVIETLETNGYRIVSVKRTLLRRLCITADNGAYTREVIISRSTGEIKRDLGFQIATATGSTSGIIQDDDDAKRTPAISKEDSGEPAGTTSNEEGFSFGESVDVSNDISSESKSVGNDISGESKSGSKSDGSGESKSDGKGGSKSGKKGDSKSDSKGDKKGGGKHGGKYGGKGGKK